MKRRATATLKNRQDESAFECDVAAFPLPVHKANAGPDKFSVRPLVILDATGGRIS